jgi:type VI secretion system protein ImpF
MAELTQKERLQPSLLDRLIDDNPSSQREPRDRWVLTLRQLRDAVLRDLTWLLNTDNMHNTQLAELPLVAKSVLNYGFPDLSGLTATSIEARELTRTLRQVIRDFEPRLIDESVRVRVIVSEDQYNRNAVAFEIKADLWAHPVPLDLLLKTEIDLETGHVTVQERGGK